MTAIGQADAVQFYNSLERPVLILSSRAGRGNISIAEAIHEHFSEPADVHHRSIEDFLPTRMVHEDLVRYKLLSTYFPAALAAIYKVPVFYCRKLLREKMRTTRLDLLQQFLATTGIATVVCVSHRQAFWTAVLKRNASLDIAIYGVLTEFGPSLGWKYIFWDQMDGFVSPIGAAALRSIVPATLPFQCLPLPARSSFHALANQMAPKGHCLLMAGFWGQGRALSTLRLLVRHFPNVHVHAVCGDNARLKHRLQRQFGHARNVSAYGLLDSVKPLLARCGSVVTKPGMATLLEARASGRKIFLFQGMPVAETHNARYAMVHFDAEQFTVGAFSRWLGQEVEDRKSKRSLTRQPNRRV